MSGLKISKEGFAAIVRALVLAELDAAERVRAQHAARSVAEVQLAAGREMQQAAFL